MLGLWLAVSPWIVGYAEHEVATGNAIVGRPGARARLALRSVACDELPDGVAQPGRRRVAGVRAVRPRFSSCRGDGELDRGRRLVALLAASALSLDKEIGKLWHRRATIALDKLCGNLRAMFTGIVQAVGKIVRTDPLEIDCGGLDLADVAVGDSICVQGRLPDGNCAKPGKGFTADVSAETLRVTPAWTGRARSTWRSRSPSATNWAGTWSPGTSTASGEVPAGRQRGRVPRAQGGGRYLARQGLDLHRRREPHGERVEPNVRGQPDPAHAQGHHAGAACARGRVNLEVDLIARYVERMLGER